MVIGVVQLSLFISQANSLKSKRMALKSLKDKIRHRFNVSVAEVGDWDKWQSGVLAVCCVNSEKKFLNSILSKIVNLAERQAAVELLDHTIDFY